MSSGARANYALAVLFSINTLNFFDRQVIGAVGEAVKAEWQLGDGALGILGTAFTILYAFAGMPLGWLADRFSRKKILAAGCFVWSLFTAASGFAQSYWQLFAARLCMGAGEASCAPAATSLLGDLFPPGRRGRALSIFMLGLPVGVALSYFVCGRITAKYDFRAAFLIAGLPGLALALVALTLPEPRRGTAEAACPQPDSPGGSRFLAVLSIPTMWWIIASGVLHNFNFTAVGSFLVSFLKRWHGLEFADAGDFATTIAGLSGIPGLIAGGIVSDALRRRRADGRLLTGAVAVLASAPLAYFAFTRPRGEPYLFAALLAASTALMYAYYSSVYATIQDVVEPRLRGTAMAIYFFAMYVLGAAAGPAVVGALSDRFARSAARAAGVVDTASPAALLPFSAEGLRSAMLLIPALTLLLAGVLYGGSRTVARDIERRSRGSAPAA